MRCGCSIPCEAQSVKAFAGVVPKYYTYPESIDTFITTSTAPYPAEFRCIASLVPRSLEFRA